MNQSTAVKTYERKPFTLVRCSVLALLALGYFAILLKGRFGPWFIPMGKVTPEIFHQWQVFLLVLTLLVWPAAVLSVILICVWGTRMATWRARDLAIVELGLGVLFLCSSNASYWIYESLLNFTPKRLAALAAVFDGLSLVVQVTAGVVVLLWLISQAKRRTRR